MEQCEGGSVGWSELSRGYYFKKKKKRERDMLGRVCWLVRLLDRD